MVTQSCVRSQIRDIFWCWTHLDHYQKSSMSPSCIYTCLNIYNPLSDHLFNRYADFLFGTPCIYSGNGFKFHSKTFTKYYENHKRVNIYFLTEAYEFYLQYTPWLKLHFVLFRIHNQIDFCCARACIIRLIGT